MGSNFFIPDDLCKHEIPSLADLRNKWKKIPLEGYRELICIEEQYFSFLCYIQSSIRYASFKNDNGEWATQDEMWGPPKAGMLFQEVVSTAKILETSLLSHGLERNIIKKSEELTLGSILKRWRDKKQPEFNKKFDKLASDFLDARNKLPPDKLHKIGPKFYDNLIEDENLILSNRTELIDLLKKLSS
jgi:hypothetical protein